MDHLQHLESIIKNYKQFVPTTNGECHLILNHLLSEIESLKDETKVSSILSKREGEILEIVSKGFTNREVASALGVSSKTVEFHLKNIYTKLDVSCRIEAITEAISKGYIKT